MCFLTHCNVQGFRTFGAEAAWVKPTATSDRKPQFGADSLNAAMQKFGLLDRAVVCIPPCHNGFWFSWLSRDLSIVHFLREMEGAQKGGGQGVEGTRGRRTGDRRAGRQASRGSLWVM